MRKTFIRVTRDSVAAGDDADAPHMLAIEVELTDTIKSVIERIVSSDYLPKISGGEATWSVTSNQPVAVVAQQWPEPHFIRLQGETCQNAGLDKLHFNYHAQDSPETVLRVLSRFRTAN